MIRKQAAMGDVIRQTFAQSCLKAWQLSRHCLREHYLGGLQKLMHIA